MVVIIRKEKESKQLHRFWTLRVTIKDACRVREDDGATLRRRRSKRLGREKVSDHALNGWSKTNEQPVWLHGLEGPGRGKGVWGW